MQSGCRLSCALVGALLAACSVGPRYHKPGIPVARQWDAPLQPSEASVWPESDWWHRFGSPRLDELIGEAERSNDDLAGAMARIQEADAQLRIAGAPLLPTVDLAATGTRERASVSGEGFSTYNVFNPVLAASYELDFWGDRKSVV